MGQVKQSGIQLGRSGVCWAQRAVVCRLTCRHHVRFRCGAAEASASVLGQELTRQHRKRFLLLLETLDSAGRLHWSRTADQRHRLAAADSCGGGIDRLVAEGRDVISRDLHTWLGTLCVVLWLLYLILL